MEFHKGDKVRINGAIGPFVVRNVSGAVLTLAGDFPDQETTWRVPAAWCQVAVQSLPDEPPMGSIVLDVNHDVWLRNGSAWMPCRPRPGSRSRTWAELYKEFSPLIPVVAIDPDDPDLIKSVTDAVDVGVSREQWNSRVDTVIRTVLEWGAERMIKKTGNT